MAIPEFQNQDTYGRGFDVVRIFSNEFGSSPQVIRSQLNASTTTIEIDDEEYKGDRFFIPIKQAAGKRVSLLGPERQWRMKFPVPEID